MTTAWHVRYYYYPPFTDSRLPWGHRRGTRLSWPRERKATARASRSTTFRISIPWMDPGKQFVSFWVYRPIDVGHRKDPGGEGEKENTNIPELKSMCKYLTAKRLLFYISLYIRWEVSEQTVWSVKTCKTSPALVWRLVPSRLSAPGLPTSQEWAAPRQLLSLCSVSHLFPSWPHHYLQGFIHLFICLPAVLAWPSHQNMNSIRAMTVSIFWPTVCWTGNKSIEVTPFFYNNWVHQWLARWPH